MSRLSCLQRGILRAVAACGMLAVCSTVLPARGAAEPYQPPRGGLQGFSLGQPRHPDVPPGLDIVVELQPRDRQLDAVALGMEDAASSGTRQPLSEAAFAARFGRSEADVNAVAAFLRRYNASDVYVSRNRLVVGGYLSLPAAQRAFGRFALYVRGDEQIFAPAGPVSLPVNGIRSVHGIVAAYTPRLADTPTLPNDFRGAWFPPIRFRDAYDAVPNGGAGSRIALIEDSSDRFNVADLAPFITGAGAALDMLFGFPLGGSSNGRDAANAAASFGGAFGANTSRVREVMVATPLSGQECGRDDRGQEAGLDVVGAMTLAPMASIDIRYDRVCVRGGEGLIALQRTLDADPTPDVVVFPFNLGPVRGPTALTWGPTPIAFLEAAVRGIPVIVPSGDDGALGYRTASDNVAGVGYPCVLPVNICAGGTQLGMRSGAYDEAPWNDGVHATGGGISWDPRPAWQSAPSGFEFSRSFPAADHRLVPDISADASGHLESFWHSYGFGGVGGTSESAALVGAQLATINAAVPPSRRILGPADLYALARNHPEAFRRVSGDNDRGYYDNTLRPKPLPPPLGFHGRLPPAPPLILGCGPNVQANGCSVRGSAGYNAVVGLGSLREKEAIDALRSFRQALRVPPGVAAAATE